MKRNLRMQFAALLFTCMATFTSMDSNAQIDLKKKVGDLKKKVENTIGKGKDKPSDTTAIGNGEDEGAAETSKNENEAKQEKPTTVVQSPEKAYSKFDFIPGDKVLFEDDFRNESSDEIPSFWVVTSGKVEVARINGELVMGMLESNPTAYPRQKAGNEYPDRITLEFDYLWRFNSKPWEEAWRDGNTAGGDQLKIRFAIDKVGIEGSRLTAKGYGETKPLSPNATPEQKANNRRVEFVKQ